MDRLLSAKEKALSLYFSGFKPGEVVKSILKEDLCPKDKKYFLEMFFRSRESYSGIYDCWTADLLQFFNGLNSDVYERHIKIFLKEAFSNNKRHSCSFCVSKLAKNFFWKLNWTDDPAEFGITRENAKQLSWGDIFVQKRFEMGAFRSQEEYIKWMNSIPNPKIEILPTRVPSSSLIVRIWRKVYFFFKR